MGTGVDESMRYGLFLGCTIPARARNYEISAVGVAKRLGISLQPLKEAICCGFPIKANDERAAHLLGAYNLALAEEAGLDICTLCSSCASALTEVAHRAASDPGFLGEVNAGLSKEGKAIRRPVRVRHFARILFEEVPEQEILSRIQRPLEGLRVAIHYGCHYLKPSEIYEGFDSVEAPESLDRLVRLTGAEVLDYPGRKRCCGGPLLPVEEKLALSVAREKLEDVSRVGAEALVLVCPFCALMYDGNQKGIETAFGGSYSLPVLYLTQLLGLAMGMDRKELGFQMNVVKTKDLLDRFVG